MRLGTEEPLPGQHPPDRRDRRCLPERDARDGTRSSGPRCHGPARRVPCGRQRSRARRLRGSAGGSGEADGTGAPARPRPRPGSAARGSEPTAETPRSPERPRSSNGPRPPPPPPPTAPSTRATPPTPRCARCLATHANDVRTRSLPGAPRKCWWTLCRRRWVGTQVHVRSQCSALGTPHQHTLAATLGRVCAGGQLGRRLPGRCT